jgi:hypothetical protein
VSIRAFPSRVGFEAGPCSVSSSSSVCTSGRRLDRPNRGSQPTPRSVGQGRLDRHQRGHDIAPKPQRLVVARVQRNPSETADALRRPLGEQARLAPPGGGADQRQLRRASALENLHQLGPRHHPRTRHRHQQLRTDNHEGCVGLVHPWRHHRYSPPRLGQAECSSGAGYDCYWAFINNTPYVMTLVSEKAWYGPSTNGSRFRLTLPPGPDASPSPPATSGPRPTATIRR